MDFNPDAFKGTASHYVRGRPPYSADLPLLLASELHLDGTGHLIDVGCGPATLTVMLAHLFNHVTCVDPEPDMIEEAERQCVRRGIVNVSFVRARAEDLHNLELPDPTVVAFGQSFHRVSQTGVADQVHRLLRPGGSIALVTHRSHDRDHRIPGGLPRIPHDAIVDLIVSELGQSTADYLARWRDEPRLSFQQILEQSPFGRCTTICAPGRDLIQDIDGVVANYFSMSYSAPRLFGDRRDAFEAKVRDVLLQVSPDGQFSEWPGDTEVVLATKR